MVKRIEFNVSDQVAEWLEKVSLSDDLNKKARELFLLSLSATYDSLGDMGTAKKIDAEIEKLS